MTFLPIVSRELRLASRRPSTYWLRSGAALVVVVLGAWLFLMLRGASPKELARVLFSLLTGGAVVFALLSGPRFTSDCLSEEKREGTLGLLFLTDLKGYDVVLGKLAAGSISSFYSVIAVLPMMAVPLLMGGGITLAEFGRISLVLINALLFSLTAGICVSSVSRSAHRAAATSSLLVLVFVALLPSVAGLAAIVAKTRHLPFWLLAPSVGYSYYLCFDSTYKIYRVWFWISLAVVHGLSWLFLAIASLVTPRSWQERVPGQNLARWGRCWNAWTYGRGAERTNLRRRLLEVNPVFWLTARIRSKPAMVWCLLGILSLAWFVGWWKFRRDWLDAPVYVATAILLNVALRYWLAGESSLAMAEGRKNGALELLLSTPLRIEEILQGQWLALRRQFLGPVLAVLTVEVALMLLTLRESVSGEDRRIWGATWIAGMVMFVADLVALYWLAMWQGLNARNAVRAAGSSLARVMVLPWLAYGLVLLLLVLKESRYRSSQPSPGWQFFLGLWFGLGLAVDFGFGAWARQQLLGQFRRAAQQPYGASFSFWQRWLHLTQPQVARVATNSGKSQARR